MSGFANCRTIHRKGSIVGIEMVHAAAGSTWRAGRLKCNGMERRPGGRGYLRGRDSLVHDYVIPHRKAICDLGVIICSRSLVVGQPMRLQVMIVQIVPRDKRVMSIVEPAIIAAVHGMSVEGHSHTGPVRAARGQGCPAAVIIAVTPAYPRRPPNCIRRPAPAQPSVAEPASIVKRRPAPGITRAPIPSAVCINPVTAVTVGLPERINHHNRRLPTGAIAINVDP